MKKIIFSLLISLAASSAFSQTVTGQPCITKEALATLPGIYTNAANYKWPGVRAEYYKKLTTAPEKATAKQVLTGIETLELTSRQKLPLEGGSLENTYSSEGYVYLGTNRLADYRFQMAFHEWTCINKKIERNGEYGTVLRVYVNLLPFNTFRNNFAYAYTGPQGAGSEFIHKNYKPTDESPRIALFSFIKIPRPALLQVINGGKGFYQDVPEKDIAAGTRQHITRYWVVTKNDSKPIVEVTRKEYLEGLLEYYEKEKIFFAKMTTDAKKEYDRRMKSSETAGDYKAQAQKNAADEYNRIVKQYYPDWQNIVENKKAIVNKVLTANTLEWLSRPAVVYGGNPDDVWYPNKADSYDGEDRRRTQLFTFDKFYDNEKDGIKLYTYNPGYFSAGKNAASPRLICIAFRYIPQPSSVRLVNNFTKHFDFAAVQKML